MAATTNPTGTSGTDSIYLTGYWQRDKGVSTAAWTLDPARGTLNIEDPDYCVYDPRPEYTVGKGEARSIARARAR
ncbi:hypothetical protein PG993_010243 [Apiospora rasikravindrae]|uniref:Lipocalin-like domain-containing protein n=1 Tax=Apiospora rasikravindrae TaxID=990691 RepID=A0ABR1SLP0_9PEZI